MGRRTDAVGLAKTAAGSVKLGMKVVMIGGFLSLFELWVWVRRLLERKKYESSNLFILYSFS